jgi:hypothetical protein
VNSRKTNNESALFVGIIQKLAVIGAGFIRREASQQCAPFAGA